MKIQLIEKIKKRIQNEGPLPFSAYMELALYDNEMGYYSTLTELGAAGDFTTAPELTYLYAQALSDSIKPALKTTHPKFLELGAGTGAFAEAAITYLSQDFPSLHYFILEKSPSLQKTQQERLSKLNTAVNITWLNKLPTDFEGVIFGNEVLDALPFDCFTLKAGQCFERRVGLLNDTFNWELTPASHTLTSFVNALNVPTPYASEIHVNYQPFITQLSQCLKTGIILFADYGYGRKEYYHPERNQGTLTCFFEHTQNTDPFEHVGQQDMTAHVDFTAVADIAMDNGLSLTGFTTQTAYLLSAGILNLAEKEVDSTLEQYEIAQKLKTLLLPTQMGETIKIIGLSKNYSDSLPGFKMHDRRDSLFV